MKIVSVVGARPQFIKCAPVSRELRKDHEEILVHTGQHYDPQLSDIFFEELDIPKPDYNLGIGSGDHGKQTGEMLIKIEEVLKQEQPDFVLVYGDTNSTAAGALAAVKMHIPVTHVEAGLRSFDRAMPEEINRIVTDHISDLLFCPTETALKNLAHEGITRGIHLVGDVMADALEYNKKIAMKKSVILKTLSLADKNYNVLTLHRPGNTDNPEKLAGIMRAINDSCRPIIFPVHPRTRKCLIQYGLLKTIGHTILFTEPLGYLDMIRLMRSANKVLTDSGGMQKEAYMLGIPCITLRDTTEWVETLEGGWNMLVGATESKIISAIEKTLPTKPQRDLFPLGASRKIRAIFNNYST
jgi:UDP-GlcNAc3NAcA epimerase